MMETGLLVACYDSFTMILIDTVMFYPGMIIHMQITLDSFGMDLSSDDNTTCTITHSRASISHYSKQDVQRHCKMVMSQSVYKQANCERGA